MAGGRDEHHTWDASQNAVWVPPVGPSSAVPKCLLLYSGQWVYSQNYQESQTNENCQVLIHLEERRCCFIFGVYYEGTFDSSQWE